MIPLSGDLAKAKGIKSESVDSIDVTKGTSTLKRGFAHMLKNGVVMDVLYEFCERFLKLRNSV